MLMDVAFKNLKPKEKPYKVADCDGMYVVVAPSGTVTFRLDYRLNGRRETVTFGQYGPAELSLVRAHDMTIGARRSGMECNALAHEKQHAKRRIKGAKSVGDFGARWLSTATMADITCAMPAPFSSGSWSRPAEIALRTKSRRMIIDRCALRSSNAARRRRQSMLATSSNRFTALRFCMGRRSPTRPTKSAPHRSPPLWPRTDRCSRIELLIMLKQLEHVATLPTIRPRIRLFLLTMVRKSEPQDTTWDEVDFENDPKRTIIPAARSFDSFVSRRAAGILLIWRAAAPPTPRAYQSAHGAAGITC
jgi:hypothetical protein